MDKRYLPILYALIAMLAAILLYWPALGLPLIYDDLLHIRISGELESISSEKHTALGDGYFVTNKTTYWDQHDEVVAEMRFRILWFKPRQRGGE